MKHLLQQGSSPQLPPLNPSQIVSNRTLTIGIYEPLEDILLQATAEGELQFCAYKSFTCSDSNDGIKGSEMIYMFYFN